MYSHVDAIINDFTQFNYTYQYLILRIISIMTIIK